MSKSPVKGTRKRRVTYVDEHDPTSPKSNRDVTELTAPQNFMDSFSPSEPALQMRSLPVVMQHTDEDEGGSPPRDGRLGTQSTAVFHDSSPPSRRPIASSSSFSSTNVEQGGIEQTKAAQEDVHPLSAFSTPSDKQSKSNTFKYSKKNAVRSTDVTGEDHQEGSALEEEEAEGTSTSRMQRKTTGQRMQRSQQPPAAKLMSSLSGSRKYSSAFRTTISDDAAEKTTTSHNSNSMLKGTLTTRHGSVVAQIDYEEPDLTPGTPQAEGAQTLQVQILGDDSNGGSVPEERYAEDERSLFIFDGDNEFRKLCYWIIEHKRFKKFILCVILLNSVALAVDQPRYVLPWEVMLTLEVLEYIFTVIFCLEMMIKVIALGFVGHDNAYLRSGWNMMDFIIVLTSVLQLAGVGSNYSAMRVFRVLRPLKTISKVKKLKHLISGLFRALPMVFDNIVFLAFILILFAIAAVQLWVGQLNQRCYISEFPRNDARYENLSVPYLVQNDPDPCGGLNGCGHISGNVTSSCEVYENIYFVRFMNYNNVGTAGFLLFKVLVLDNWPENLYDAMNMSGRASAIFFVVLTLVGSFFCVNLFLAILTQAYATHAVVEAVNDSRSVHRTHVKYSALMECGVQVDFDADLQSIMLSHNGERFIEKSGGQMSWTVDQFGRSVLFHVDSDTFVTDDEDLADEPKVEHAASLPMAFADGEEKMKSSSDGVLKDDNMVQIDSTSPGNKNDGDALETKTILKRQETEGSHDEQLGSPSFSSDKRNDSVNNRKRVQFPRSDTLDSEGINDNGIHSPKSIGSGRSNTSSTMMAHFIDNLDDIADYQEEENEEASESRSFAELMKNGGLMSAFAALEQTMDVIKLEDDHRPAWRRHIGDFVESKEVSLFIFMVSILNIIVLAIDHYPIEPLFSKILGWTSVACTICFALQLLLKVIGYGVTLTFQKPLNVFDLIMVCLSIPEVATSGGGPSGLTVIRAFRMVRVVRVLKNFQSLQAIGETIVNCWSSVGYLILLILLVLYIYAVMGMRVFGLEFGSSKPLVRASFGTLLDSLLVCFIVITGDSWTELMLTAMDIGPEQEFIAIVFFVSLYMIGNYILINLFVAIIMDKLAAKMEEMEERDIQPPTLILPFYEPLLTTQKDEEGSNSTNRNSHSDSTTKKGSQRSNSLFAVSTMGAEPRTDQMGFINNIMDERSKMSVRCRKLADDILFVQPYIVKGNSLFIFSEDNKFRRAIVTIIGSRIFDYFITLAVFGSMLFLFFESANNSKEADGILEDANFVFLMIFIVEMFMKIVAFGFIWPENETDVTNPFPHTAAYLRDPWNWVDLLINLLSVVALFVPLFKVSRSLRTIRLMIRNEKTKIIIVAMLQSLPHVLQGLTFVAFIFFVFGIMGVQLFKGEYYSCNDPAIHHRDSCYGNFTVPVQGPIFISQEPRFRSWERRPYHFDHLGASILSLFVVAVGDNWATIMYDGMDTTNPHEGLGRDTEPWMALYFVIVFICCNFFAFNMIIGILINYFSKMKKINDGSALLTPEQRLYVKARYTIDSIMFSDDLIPLDYRLSEKLSFILKYRRKGANHSNSVPVFDIFMTMVIIINTVSIAATHKDMADWEHQTIDTVNMVALVIFSLEALMKLCAYGVPQYFSVGWNRFDFTIVVLGYASFGFNQIGALSFVRVLRVIKLVKRSGIQRLLASVVRSFNSFINVLALLILTFFVYAVAGVILFGKVRHNGALTEVNNFETVPNAMLVLYQIATTEGWSEVMTACSLDQQDPGGCDPSPEVDNCGNQSTATVFFVSFMVVCAFTVLQLFVAVVVEIFTDDVDNHDPIVAGFFELKEVWTAELGAGVNLVEAEEVIRLLPVFPRVLTDLVHDRKADIIRLLSCLQIPVDSKMRVTYRDVVHALAWRKYHVEVKSIIGFVNDTFLSMVTDTHFSSFTIAQFHAANMIKEKWKSLKSRQKLENDELLFLNRSNYQPGPEAAAAAQRRANRRGATSPTTGNLGLLGGSMRKQSLGMGGTIFGEEDPFTPDSQFAGTDEEDPTLGGGVPFHEAGSGGGAGAGTLTYVRSLSVFDPAHAAEIRMSESKRAGNSSAVVLEEVSVYNNSSVLGRSMSLGRGGAINPLLVPPPPPPPNANNNNNSTSNSGGELSTGGAQQQQTGPQSQATIMRSKQVPAGAMHIPGSYLFAFVPPHSELVTGSPGIALNGGVVEESPSPSPEGVAAANASPLIDRSISLYSSHSGRGSTGAASPSSQKLFVSSTAVGGKDSNVADDNAGSQKSFSSF